MGKTNNTALLTGDERRGSAHFRPQQSEDENGGGPLGRTRHGWKYTGVNLAVAILALAAGYALFWRAIDTGSLGQYFLVLVLFIVAINRVVAAFRKAKS